MQRAFVAGRTIPAAVTLAYCVLVLPVTSSVAFSEPPDDAARLRSYALKALFAVVLYVAVARGAALVRLLRRRDGDALFGVAVAGAYLAVLTALLLTVWPGQWMWDEYWVLDAARSYSSFSWQHYLTVAFHTLCLYVVPTGVGVVLVQMVVGAVVVGYLTARIRAGLSRPRLAYLVVVPFLFVPVLFEALHPLRTTIYSLVAVLVIGRLLLLGWRPDEVGDRFRTMIGLSVLITLMAFWRTEGVAYLLLLPVVAVRLGILSALRVRTVAAAGSLVASVLVVAGGAGLTAATSQPEYSVTGLYNPLSVMVAQPLTGEDVARDLVRIDTVVDVEHMRAHADYSDVPGFWLPGALRPDFAEHMDEFYAGAASLIASNPVTFLRARAHTFLATNGLDPAQREVETADLFLDETQSPRVAHFRETNAGAQPIAPEFRDGVMRALLMIGADGERNALRPFVWTVVPTVLGLLALGTALVLRRRWYQAGLVASLLVHTGLVALTAPADYFMYYLPVYVVGNFVLVVALVRRLDRRAAGGAAAAPDRRPVPAEPAEALVLAG